MLMQFEPTGNSAPLTDTEFYILIVFVFLAIVFVGIKVINFLKGFSK